MTGFQNKQAMSQNLVEFRNEVQQLGNRKLKALYLLYKEQLSPGVNDTVRRDIIECELYERKVLV
jgi:hypothetical protein